MDKPGQNAPVERLYLRHVLGWQSPPEPTAGSGKSKAGRSKSPPPAPASYLVGLTAFHIRPRGGR